MKILVVCQYFYPEEFKVNELVEGLLSRGHEVTVLTGKPTYPRGPYPKGYKFLGIQKENYKGARVIRLPELTRGNGNFWGILKSLVSFFVSSSWYARTHEIDADAIICFQLSPITMANAALIYKKKNKAKLLHWVQDLWPESITATTSIKNGPIIALIERFVKKIYTQSDYILVQSNAFKDSICSKANFNNKIVYAPNWADTIFTSNISHKPEKISLDKYIDFFNVMFAGNIGEAQDFSNIIKAANYLKQNQKIKWLIIGDGRYRETAEQQVKQLGLQNNVIFLGRYPVNTMSYFFKYANALLVTLKDEYIFSLTIPSKTQAYMASGKPILTMLNGEGNRVITDAQCGLTADSGDFIGLAENILKMSDMDKEELERLGNNGLQYYRKHFDINTVIDRVNNLIIN